jgi:ABC-type multidrug transport system fused ATPase/permease subunit
MTGQKHPHAHPHPHGRVRSSVVPEYDMNIVSRYTFSYVSALIGFGASATSTSNSTSTTASTSTSSAEGHSGTCIDIEDIPHVPYNQTSEMTDEAFDKPWNEELRLNPVNPNIRKALFITHGYWFWIAFLNVIIFIFLSAIQPFFVSMLLAYVSSDDVDFVGMGSGYGIALFLGISSLVNAFILNSAMYYCYYFGMAIKSSLIARIFRKALLISNCVKENRSVGDIITLMSVDVERIWYATLLLPWLILSPIMILVSIILLLIKMSYAALLVCVFIILLGVLLEHVSKRIGKIRVEIVKHTVERTLLVNETLQGIRVVKMYAWEDIIQNKIETVRRKEVLLLRKYLVLKMIGVVSVWNDESLHIFFHGITVIFCISFLCLLSDSSFYSPVHHVVRPFRDIFKAWR